MSNYYLGAYQRVRETSLCIPAPAPAHDRMLTVARAMVLLTTLFWSLWSFSQTVLISPSGDGGFQTGTTFAANGWTKVHPAGPNEWFVGTAAPGFTGNHAYVSSTGGATHAYIPGTPAQSHFYRDVTFPAGETQVQLSFNWSGQGDACCHQLVVSLAPTTYTLPTTGTGDMPAPAVTLGRYSMSGTVQSATINISPAILQNCSAPSTLRLIFSWRNDEWASAVQPPAAVDNISLTSTTPSFSGAGGTFTINNQLPAGGTNFTSFSAAINSLNAAVGCGLTGAFTFNVAAGQTFPENPPFLTTTGTASFPIIFQKDGAGANPVVTPTGSSAATDFGLGINGGTYITFDGIDVNASAVTAVEFGYLIRNSSATVGAHHNTIRNCSVTLNRTNIASIGILNSASTVGAGFTPSGTDGSNSFNLIENVVVQNASRGIFVTSGTATWPGSGNNIRNSTIGVAYSGIPTGDIGTGTTAAYGISYNNQGDHHIRNNIVRNIAANNINRGIQVAGARGITEISGNRIRGVRNTGATSTSGQRGLDLGGATAGAEVRVFNNFVSDITSAHTGTATATRVLQGIYISTGGAAITYRIDHNNVSIDGSGSPTVSSVALETITTTSVNIFRNNVLANFTGTQTTAKHHVIRTSGTNTLGAAGSYSNHNVLYLAISGPGTNGFIGQTSATDRATIADWTAAITVQPGTDANSINVNPMFVNPQTDLHVANPLLAGAGMPGVIGWALTDIDGNFRPDPPTIGAHELAPVAACTGVPDAGSISGPSSICANTNFTLTLAGATTGEGISYQWQSSTTGAGGPWTNVGTNQTSFTTTHTTSTWYQVVVTCASPGGGTSTTAVEDVTLAPFYDCYCSTGLGGSTGACPTVFTFGEINNTSPNCTSPFYTRYPQTPGLTGTFARGVTYTMTVNTSTTAIVSAWIDYDQDGVFEASEWTQVFTTGTSGSVQITIPATAQLGLTGLRLRTRSSGSANAAGDACLNMPTGSTHDYLIEIAEAPECLATNVSVLNVTANSAEITFSTDGAPNNFDYEIRTSGSAGSGPVGLAFSGTVAASPITLAGLTPGTSYFVHVRANCPEPDPSYWSGGVSFTTPCGTFDVPFAQDLDATPVGSTTVQSIPNCWTVVDLNGVTSGNSGRWNTLAAPVGVTYNNLLTGNVLQYTYAGTLPGDDWLFTPGIALTGGVSYQLNYHLGHNSGTSYTERVAVRYGTSPDPVSMTTLLADHTLTTTTANVYEHHFTPPATGVYYISWHVFSAANQFNIYLDEISLVTSPICATVNPTLQENCENGEYSVLLEVADLGEATSVSATYTVDQGTPVTTSDITTSVVLGPFPVTSMVDVWMDLGFTTCDEEYIGAFHSTCPIAVDCGSTQPVMIEHCYRNNDTRTFTFVGTDPDNTLDLKFIQPSPIAPGDAVTIVNGYIGQGTQIPAIVQGNELSTMGTLQSTGNVISIIIQADGAGSCEDGATTDPWNIQVRCSGCIEPEADVYVNTDCEDYSFTVELDIWDLGYSAVQDAPVQSVSIGYSVNNGPQIVMEDLTEDYYILGPFPVGSSVNVAVLHPDGPACDLNPGTFSEDIPCPPANDACTDAAPLVVNNTGGCPGAAITGTTLYAGLTGALPACASTAGTPIQDVWYSFNTGGYINPLALRLTTGTAHNVGYQLFSACGTAMTIAGSCNALVNGTVDLPNLVQNTNYWLRIFTRTNLGPAGSFNICLSGTHGATLCAGAMNIPSAPVVDQPVVCQSSNLLNSTNVPAVCGGLNTYKNGVEALYTFTPSVTGTYNISITGQTYTAIFVYANACPAAGGACVGGLSSTTNTKTLIVALTAGTTYYIWFDTNPSFTAGPCTGTGSVFSIVQDLCPAPTALNASGITTTTANIGWTGAPGTYIIEYGPSASFTAAGTGPLQGTGSTMITTTNNPHTLTGLLGNTQYRAFVRRDCSLEGNGYSNNSIQLLFTTMPNPPMDPECNSMWYDSGGPLANYANSENWVRTICPPAGQVARITFTQFQTEANYDRLHIYNGPTIESPMFASPNGVGFPTTNGSPYGAGGWWGNLNTNLPGPFLSTHETGCLTFAFWSDPAVNNPGWSASIDCFTPVIPACVQSPTAPADGSSGCVGATTLSWPGVTEASGYDVYLDMGPTATTLVATNQPGTTYNAGTLGAGTYTWMVVPRSSLGAASGCPSWTFTRVPPPTATATNSGPVCVGGDIQLTATTNGTFLSWTGPGGYTSNEQNPLLSGVTTANAGTYTFTSTLNGCTSAPASTNVVVSAPPTGVTATASLMTVAPGASVDLAATGTAAGTALASTFNSGPEAWTVVNNSTGGTNPELAQWTLRQSPYTVGTTTFSSNDASQFFHLNSAAQGSGSMTQSILTSPVFSLAGFTTATLNFHHFYQHWSSGYVLTAVQVSTNGTTWTTLQEYASSVGSASAFAAATINMNAYVGQSSLQIRFFYHTSWGYHWAVDNVRVSGQQTSSFAWTSEPAGFTSTEQNPQNVVVNNTTTYTVTASTPLGCNASASVTVTVPQQDDDCPGPGQVGDPCDDGDPTTINDTVAPNCECHGTPTGPATQHLTLEVQADANGADIAYEILAQGTFVQMCEGSGFQSNAFMTVSCSLPEGCYVLRVYDDGGDGITNGGYILRTTDGRRIIDNRFNFHSGGVSAIANYGGFCLPIGPDRTIFTSCDKLDWVGNQHLVASLNPAVTAVWQTDVPVSQQSSTTGYEYWFFDPNGTYSYRHFKSHASGGYGGLGYDKAAHLLLNNWNAANHLPVGVLLNVRVRSVVNGVEAEWGPACRFMIDPLAAACPMTKLIDIPGHTFISCGQWRQWATNQAVHARPVGGATQYEFRFVSDGGNHDIIRTSHTYFTRLGWDPTLAGIGQWEVTVRAFKDGDWCPWGEACTVNIGTQPANPNMLMHEQEDAVDLLLWPNPNRGDMVNISLSPVEETVTTIAVDMYDLHGRRVMTRTIPNQGGFINTVMDLQGDLATGVYMVNMTVGEKVYTQRLVIQQ